MQSKPKITIQPNRLPTKPPHEPGEEIKHYRIGYIGKRSYLYTKKTKTTT